MTAKNYTQLLMDSIASNKKLCGVPSTFETVIDAAPEKLTNKQSIIDLVKKNFYGNIRISIELGMNHTTVLVSSDNPFFKLYNLLIQIGNDADIDEQELIATVNTCRETKYLMHWSTLIQNVMTNPALKEQLLTILSDDTKDLMWL